MRSLVRTRLLFAAALLTFTLVSARDAASQTLGPGEVLISEFRLEGPAGDSDEYIELYCNRDTNCDVSGYRIRSYDPNFGEFTVTLPPTTFITAREHLLIADLSQYSLNDYAPPDVDVASGFDVFLDNEGFQLRTPDETTVLDSVGFAGTGGRPGEDTNFIEGTGLQRATAARPDDQYAYLRKMGTATAGRPQDTNNNANDFVLVSVTGAAHAGITNPPVLGAPGPQYSAAPRTFGNSVLTGSLVEPAASASAAPNRVITLGGDNRYKLSIRRTITNNTLADNVGYLAFRVIDITTLNSPQVFPQQAQLRLITSGDAETFTNSQGRTVVIRGTILEFDAGAGSEPEQPNGGGLNTTVFVPVPPEGIAPGESIDVQFLLDVVQGGNYRFFVNVEANLVDQPSPPGVSPVTTSSATSSTTATRRTRTGTGTAALAPALTRKATVVKRRSTVLAPKKVAPAPTGRATARRR